MKHAWIFLIFLLGGSVVKSWAEERQPETKKRPVERVRHKASEPRKIGRVASEEIDNFITPILVKGEEASVVGEGLSSGRRSRESVVPAGIAVKRVETDGNFIYEILDGKKHLDDTIDYVTSISELRFNKPDKETLVQFWNALADFSMNKELPDFHTAAQAYIKVKESGIRDEGVYNLLENVLNLNVEETTVEEVEESLKKEFEE